MGHVDIANSSMWTQGKATLILKIVAPSVLDTYRGIACLTAVDAPRFGLLRGFEPHRQAAEGVYAGNGTAACMWSR